MLFVGVPHATGRTEVFRWWGEVTHKKMWVGMCSQLSKTLTLAKTEIYDFLCPMYENLITYV